MHGGASGRDFRRFWKGPARQGPIAGPERNYGITQISESPALPGLIAQMAFSEGQAGDGVAAQG